jgi:hypothetical protein
MGGVRDADHELATDDPADQDTYEANLDMLTHGFLGIVGVPLPNPNGPGLYYPTFFTLKSKSRFLKTLPPFQNTLTFASTCWSAFCYVLPNIFGANGGAFYGFYDSIKGTTTRNGQTIPGFSERIGPQVFTQLLNNYTNVTDAYNSVDHEPLPGETLGPPTQTKGIFKAPDVPFGPPPGTPLASQFPTFVLVTANPGVAYLGNPQITAPGYTQPYFLPLVSRLDLQTQLDGASSCSGVMNLNWINTATGGHLTPDTGSGQDNFTNTSDSATYTSLGILPPQGGLPTDTVTVNFLPDPSNPPFAQACATVTTMPDQILHVVFDGQGHSNYTTNGCTTPVCDANYTGTADLNWYEAWDVHIPAIPGCATAGPRRYVCLYFSGPARNYRYRYYLGVFAAPRVELSGTARLWRHHAGALYGRRRGARGIEHSPPRRPDVCGNLRRRPLSFVRRRPGHRNRRPGAGLSRLGCSPRSFPVQS